MRFASFTEAGPRSRNEDRLLAGLPQPGNSLLFAVTDGIGGSDDGALAADLVMQSVRDSVETGADLPQIFQQAKIALDGHQGESGEKLRIGTTLSIVSINSSTLEFGHVGDTRIYHLRGKGLKTLTQDQTEIAELVRKGIFSKREARNYNRKSVLTSALTNYSDYQLQIGQLFLEPEDRIVLLSDGVYSCVPKSKIADLSVSHRDVLSFCDALRDAAEAASPSDNFSAVCVAL